MTETTIDTTENKIPNVIVDKYYEMDPETETLLFDGTCLVEGMIVLVEDSNNRVSADGYDADMSLPFSSNTSSLRLRNRWARISDVHFDRHIVSFIATYFDGVKRKRTEELRSAWIVKNSSIPDPVMVIDGDSPNYIPDSLVGKYDWMDSETEDVLLNGSYLRKGMVIVLEKSSTRENIVEAKTTTMDEALFERIHENNMWAEIVSDVVVVDSGVHFVARYSDGSKRARRLPVNYSWLVKKYSVPMETEVSVNSVDENGTNFIGSIPDVRPTQPLSYINVSYGFGNNEE